VRADDFGRQRRLAREIATPIQIGENFMGPEQMARRSPPAPVIRHAGCAAHRWRHRLDARRALAQGAGMRCRANLFPETSCHLLAATQPATGSSFVDWPRRFCRTRCG